MCIGQRPLRLGRAAKLGTCIRWVQNGSPSFLDHGRLNIEKPSSDSDVVQFSYNVLSWGSDEKAFTKHYTTDEYPDSRKPLAKVVIVRPRSRPEPLVCPPPLANVMEYY